MLTLASPPQPFPEVSQAHPFAIDFLEAQALALDHQGEPARARALRQQALQALSLRLPADHWRVIELRRQLEPSTPNNKGT